MTPHEFVRRWTGSRLGEKQTYQAHFRDVCDLVEHAHPDGTGMYKGKKEFKFEKYTGKKRGNSGYADVFFDGNFAIEYKAPNRNKSLDAAFQQLLRYQRQLKNPPLLIVTDIENWRIHTNFNGTVPEEYDFTNSDIAAKPEVLQWLRYIFFNPHFFNPERNTHVVTRESANALKAVADDLRLTYGVSPEQAARFLTRIIFSLFAEDIGLLPSMAESQGLLSYIVEHNRDSSEDFRKAIEELFLAMEDGKRMYSKQLKEFNGALFKDIETERLSRHAISSLYDACKHDWRYVEPAIFGTLFERCLDPAKRAQLGAHYTSPEDILLIVKPVLMQPLQREWEASQAKAQAVSERLPLAGSVRERESIKAELLALRDAMLDRLRSIRVLDPACGSGNFLYIALQELMNLELDIINDELWKDLERAELGVSPAQLYGIEKDEIAHALASIVVWIGYIKWREDHGFRYDEKPLLKDLSENIVCKDAILAFDDEGNTMTPEWPKVDVIVGNPPFLGNRILRPELGDDYVDALVRHYQPHFGDLTPDLVCYWHQKALSHLLANGAERVGLLATNSIRGGTNRVVLQQIVNKAWIFNAWSDREWILDGAAVRVSMICFSRYAEEPAILDGIPQQKIYADLTADIDLTSASALPENAGISFQGIIKRGPL